jgi:hypothetical protein
MWFSSVVASASDRVCFTRARNRREPTHRAGRPMRKPTLEPLEDRYVLSSLLPLHISTGSATFAVAVATYRLDPLD